MIFRIAVLSLSAVCSIVHAAELTEVVRCTEIAFSRSVEARDADRFRALIDPDARFVGGTVQRGRDEIFAAWKVFFDEDGPRIVWRPQFIEVLEDGSLALTRGPYRVTTRNDDGSTVTSWGTFNSVWRRNDDGNWRVVFDAGSASEDPTDEMEALLEQPVSGCTEDVPKSPTKS